MLRSAGLLLFVLTACAPVKPWQRGELAQPAMRFDAYPLAEALQRQVHVSREAARGGDSFGGTGCGCN